MRLDLSWNMCLGDAAVAPLAAMTRLTHLDLSYCDRVRPPEPAPVRQERELRSLVVQAVDRWLSRLRLCGCR